MAEYSSASGSARHSRVSIANVGIRRITQAGEVDRNLFYVATNLQDEGDNHLIELAVAGGAQAIVSRNTRDLKNAELLFPDTQILTPKQCLEVFMCPS